MRLLDVENLGRREMDLGSVAIGDGPVTCAILPKDIVGGFLNVVDDFGVISDPIVDVPNVADQVYMTPDEIDLVIRAITADAHLGLHEKDWIRMRMRRFPGQTIIVVESTCLVPERFLSAGTNARVAAVTVSELTTGLDWVKSQVEGADGVF